MAIPIRNFILMSISTYYIYLNALHDEYKFRVLQLYQSLLLKSFYFLLNIIWFFSQV